MAKNPKSVLKSSLRTGEIYPSEIASSFVNGGYTAKQTALTINKQLNNDIVDYGEIAKVNKKIAKNQKNIENPEVSIVEKQKTATKSIVATSIAEAIAKGGGRQKAIWLPSSSGNPSLDHMQNYGREFYLDEGIDGEIPGERPNCQCGFLLVEDLTLKTQDNKEQVVINGATDKAVIKAKKTKMTKTEIAIETAKQRGIENSIQIVELMKELGIKGGAVYNKIKASLSTFDDTPWRGYVAKDFWEYHKLIKEKRWGEIRVWDSKRGDDRKATFSEVDEMRRNSAKYLIKSDPKGEKLGKYFDFVKKIAEET